VLQLLSIGGASVTTTQDLTSNQSYLLRRCVLFNTNGHNTNPLIFYVKQCLAEDFSILFWGVFVWIRDGENIKLLKHSYPKQSGI
jgi:hypothetical protein